MAEVNTLYQMDDLNSLSEMPIVNYTRKDDCLPKSDFERMDAFIIQFNVKTVI